MKLQQIQNFSTTTGRSSGGGAYKMADLTKKMSPDNPTQILTTHDLASLRTLQRAINTSSLNNNNNNTVVEDSIVYTSHSHNNNNSNNRNHNYNHNSSNITTSNGIHNHHNNNTSNSNSSSSTHVSGGNIVFSTIPFDAAHTVFIQPSHLLPPSAAASLATSSGLQQATQTPPRGLVTAAATAGTNGLRTVSSISNGNLVASSIGNAVSNATTFINSNTNNSNNNNSNNINNNNRLNNFLAKATILSAADLSNVRTSGKLFNSGSNINNSSSIISNNNNGSTTFSAGSTNMPTTSKYVLLQPNGNGQFTTYEGPTPAAAAAAAANGNASAPSVGNIVLLATEPMDTTVGGDATAVGRVIATATTGTGDNDEELRPLAWLNDSNLIKGIVTTSAAGGVKRVTGGGGALGNSGNICIVSASNAHELIEELPHHVGSEEVTTTIPSGSVSTNISSNNNNNNGTITTPTELKAGTQITALSVSDFQQLKRFGNIITAGTPITLLPQHDANVATVGRKDESPTTHIFGNIGAISATTTVHMGPSGTTTVVEYKSNGNIPTLQPRQLLSAAAVGNANSGTTITPANLSNSAGNHNTHNNNSNNMNSTSNYVPSSPSASTTTHSTQSSVANTPSASAVPSNHPASLSVSYSTAPSSTLSVAGANNNGGTTVLSLSKQLTTLPGGVVTVTNGNGTTNTIYQGQQQHKQQQPIVNSNTNNSSNSASSTTHHPHKKYLREKMNVLDHGGGGGSGVGGGGNNSVSSNASGNGAASTITVVASPASSSSSFSSSVSMSSSSSSTAAVNGGNSPVSKSFYASAANNSHSHNSSSTVNGNNNSSGAINYSSTANATSTVVLANTVAGGTSVVATNAATSSPIATSIQPTYIMQYQSVASSPSISSPEPINSKEFYPLVAPQQQQQRNSMRSPTSYSSYDNDSLKDFEISTNSSSGLGRHNTSTPQHQTHQSAQAQQQLSSSGSSSASSKNSHTGGGGAGGGGVVSSGSGAVTPQKQKHPNNVPYDPFVHTHNKPPYSFSSLIFMAIEGSNEKALPVKEIYAWIMQHFPYFKTAPAGWKNSVRHNLSLNKSFVKVEKAPNMGKGSLWRVEPQQRQNLIQALNRSPFFPNSAVDKSSSLKSPGGNDSLVGYDTVDSVGSGGGGACSPAPKSNINPRIDPRLFPKLSKVIGGQGLLNDVIVSGAGDGPDDDTPSDYSTTNHNNNNNNNNSSNNKYSNYNNSTLSQQQQNGSSGGNGGGGGGGANGATSILGPFSSYESIERLARDCGADSIDDVNAATAMLALKHGPKVFAETFQNGAPVITSSPSEDHTYSAGGGGSGATTPLTNGNSVPMATNGNTTFAGSIGQQQQNGCNGDNQSNYTSSDAAYESSEDNNNITPEELEDQRRHREGVDALLSLSRSSVVESPTKRPSSTSVEEEHISACLENNNKTSNNNNNNNGHFTNGNAKMALLTSAVAYSQQQQQQHHVYEDSSSFHSPSYYGTAHGAMHHHHLSLAGGSVQRKIKPLRSLRTKIKRKAPWMSKAR